MSSKPSKPAVEEADDTPETPISVPETGESEGGKLKMIVQLVKKCLGVKDIATMRLSLPSSLLEPIPNLEYWHYLDRPDVFAAINDSDDPFERMLAVLRFTFTKDLKFHNKICKPYNSVLGEHFRSHWDVTPMPASDSGSSTPSTPLIYTSPPATESTIIRSIPALASETASIRSERSSRSFTSSKVAKSPSTAPTSLGGGDANAAQANGVTDDNENVRIIYMTEQVSHHPPVSAYYASCPSRSLELAGVDQISAKVAGTTVRIVPGPFNKGIFVNITGGPGAGERYNISHPDASVNGILRGSFYITVSNSTVISMTGGSGPVKYRTIVEYKEEPWLGKARFLLEGVIFTYTEGETAHEAWIKVKDVPRTRVVAEFEGSWRHRVRWRKVGNTWTSSANTSSRSSLSTNASSSKNNSRLDVSAAVDADWAPLMDLSTLQIIPQAVRPLEKQLPDESRKLWASVTERLLRKEFGEATKEKVAIEQKQRDEAAERKKSGAEFVPRYFDKDIDSGFPVLTEEGKKAVEEELNESSSYHIQGDPSASLAP